MINYAHRGASAYAPENTFAAFDLGLNMNANGIETDIRRTRDGVYVLFHDDDMIRVTGIKGSVADYSFNELYALDFGIYKGEQYKGEHIVRLDEFLNKYGHSGLNLALEIKQEGIETELVGFIKEISVENYVITSFDYNQLINIKEYDETIRLGYLTSCFSHEIIDDLVSKGIYEICPKAEMLTPALCSYAKIRGLKIRAWGVTNYDLMLHACLCNVDGMTVNFPDLLDNYLKNGFHLVK